MKKLFVVAVMALMVTGHAAFASGGEIANRAVKENFKKEFPGAQFASWDLLESENLYVVRFVYENQGFIAYFYPYGEMIASARLVTKENVPYKVGAAVRKYAGDAQVLKIEELTMEGTLSYFFTVEKDGVKSSFRVYYDGTIEKLKARKIKQMDSKQ